MPNTVLISNNKIGAIANEGAQSPSSSADGRVIAFVSYSTNLIDPNQQATQSTAMLFAKDICLGAPSNCNSTLWRVDQNDGGIVANAQLDYAEIPSLSTNGRFISYSSNATNLVATDVRGLGNVYLRDNWLDLASCSPKTVLVSLGNDGSVANSGSHQQSMSADGRFVAFTSIATNLVPGISAPAGSLQDVYVRDTCIGVTRTCYPSTLRAAVLSQPAYQTPSDTGASLPAISAYGHYVVYLSSASNLTTVGSKGQVQVFCLERVSSKC